MKIQASMLHTHDGIRFEAEDLREAEALREFAMWFPPYVASVDAGPGNETRGLKALIKEKAESSDTALSVHIINVTRDKDKKPPVNDHR